VDAGAGGGDGAGDDGVAGEEGKVNIASSCVVSKGVALKAVLTALDAAWAP
jgi:hypothetical protein